MYLVDYFYSYDLQMSYLTPTTTNKYPTINDPIAILVLHIYRAKIFLGIGNCASLNI